ncbi:cytochrome b5 domain-containing protein [Candidatus Micrarchaeota archaeon]|nr:cytochrome b5 domain-containing protein [Candidatus Micrarchaeota archaeon]MBU1681438.1 cytochrome b5 domain-containing protein [Candidatus Micrarchaeota archaeon]
MKNKYIGFGLFLTLMLLNGCVAEQPADQDDSTFTNVSSHTLESISQHNSSNDCWMAIDGKVYDVTDATSPHPGGETILQGCGTDATVLFETRPMGSGTSHSQNAHDMLDDYYIGELEDV